MIVLLIPKSAFPFEFSSEQMCFEPIFEAANNYLVYIKSRGGGGGQTRFGAYLGRPTSPGKVSNHEAPHATSSGLVVGLQGRRLIWSPHRPHRAAAAARSLGSSGPPEPAVHEIAKDKWAPTV